MLNTDHGKALTEFHHDTVFWTSLILYLLRRDKIRAAKKAASAASEEEVVSRSDSPSSEDDKELGLEKTHVAVLQKELT